MTVTNTILHKGVEGNRRVHYGRLTCTSSDVVVRNMDTGLRMVETIHAWSRISGGLAIVTHPITLPERNATSGVVTIDFTTPESGAVYWKAKGTV